MDHCNPVADIPQDMPQAICPVLGTREHEDGVLFLSQKRHEKIGLAVVGRMMQALSDAFSGGRRA